MTSTGLAPKGPPCPLCDSANTLDIAHYSESGLSKGICETCGEEWLHEQLVSVHGRSTYQQRTP